MEPKDKIALLGIAATFAVALVNLFYTIRNNRRTAYVHTVTTSRLKWIDSLRDKVSAFISVTVRILNPEHIQLEQQGMNALLRERDTLMHQIILHLNPNDTEDQAIHRSVELVLELTQQGHIRQSSRSFLLISETPRKCI